MFRPATVPSVNFTLVEPTNRPQSKCFSGHMSDNHADSPSENLEGVPTTIKSDQWLGVLTISGETRNQIYGYLFSEQPVYKKRKETCALRQAQKDTSEHLSLKSVRIQHSEQVPVANDSTEHRTAKEHNQL